ncbi:MAG: D-aminoacyl-tRNA deacylase [Planctomycetota bacterium]
MRAVVQRVSRAGVTLVATGEVVGQIGAGLLVYAAAAPDDGDDDIRYIANKVAHLRIFDDKDGKLNLDVGQVGGGVLLVSAFTAHADARKSRRPSFDTAAPGPVAEPLVEKLADALRGHGLTVETGRFAQYMHIESVNDGPICILLDSRRLF